MNKSEQINELATALAKAQGEMSGAKKDSANPFFKSRYADLASVWEACREPLSKNGLAVVQAPVGESNESVSVETILTHSSGQWMSGTVTMKPSKVDPQGIGSCLTYARRYGLSAMVGIAPEDDDGNAASKRVPAEKFQKLDENCEILPTAPERKEKMIGWKDAATLQPDPEPAIDQEPKTWRDVICHLNCSARGVSLGKISDDIMTKLYNTRFKPPYSREDERLKLALGEWKKDFEARVATEVDGAK